MTNEEAKKIIFNQWQAFLEDNIDYAGISEAYKMAIKALEQQQDVHDTCIEDYPTCTECEHYDSEKHYCPRFCQVIKDTLAEAQPTDEDCISRESVVMELDKYLCGVPYEKGIDKVIKELPSVTPQKPKGKWSFIGDQMLECSSCKRAYTQNQFEELRIYTTDDLLPKYCPNCGSYNGGGEDEISN